MSHILFLIALAALAHVNNAAYCSGSPEAGERVNENKIHSLDDIILVRSVQNAKLFTAGPANARFNVAHLWGTPYEKGYAQGLLMKREMRTFIYATWAYLSEELESVISNDKIPKAAKEIIVQKGMDAALDWTSKVTEKYTSKDFTDEVQGMANSSGIPYELLWRIQMFPEVTKASCSFFGAYADATTDGKTYQLRALDYDTEGPFKNYPLVLVYHPFDSNSLAYAQVGWPGCVGSLTGMNEKKIAISEIGVGYPDDSFGQGTADTPPEKVHGEPWMFVLRDTLQFATSLKQAKEKVSSSERTCNLIIGLGDGNEGKVYGCEYSGRVANYYDDVTQLPVNDTWHPRVKNVVYNGMDWLCPTYTSVLGEQLGKYRGSIDETTIIGNILPTVQTGSLHIAIYDLTDMYMYVSFARGSKADVSQPEFAYERQFTRLDMKSIFSVTL